MSGARTLFSEMQFELMVLYFQRWHYVEWISVTFVVM